MKLVRTKTAKLAVGSAAIAGAVLLVGVAAAQDQPAAGAPPSLEITEMVIATGLTAGVPTAPVESVSRRTDTVYCFLRLRNRARAETSIRVAFERAEGEPTNQVRGAELAIPARPRWRTFARVRAWGLRAGPYRCVARGADGTVLHQQAFSVAD